MLCDVMLLQLHSAGLCWHQAVQWSGAEVCSGA